MKTKNRLTKADITPELEIRLFREFAQWGKKRKYEYIKKCPKERAFRLKYTWKAWARDNQLAPEGNWSTWVIKAGRGWGKTRTGAEWVIEKAEQYPGCHIALVGRTVADVRDVMIKGRSGILSISPPWFMPQYYPSKRLLIWPNGSYATTYSADSPDQMRGPQHSYAWCVAGDTPVLMADGTEKRIADIRIGDSIMTRQGAKHVTGQCLTKRKAEVYLLHTVGGRDIIGTAEHPVWVQGRGFVPISQLSKGMSLLCATHVSNGTAILGTSTHLPDTTVPLLDSDCIECFGSKLTGRFQRDIISIIKTVTKQITDLKTLKCSLMESTADYTLKKNWGHTVKYRLQTQLPQENETAKNAWRGLFSVPYAGKSTIAQPLIRRGSVHRRVLTLLALVRSLAKIDNVNFVEKSITRKHGYNAIAQRNAIAVQPHSVRQRRKSGRLNVRNAIPHLSRNDQMHVSAQGNAPVLSTIAVDSVEKLETLIDVYDIAVEDAHEFFANGVLVHNCDELASWQYWDAFDQLSFGLRIYPAPGVEPQCIVTTTPRNTKQIKALIADPGTIVTNGSMYDNQDNLAKRFIRDIERRYAGTRLGRQEIEGQIIDDIDGALWKRNWIEDNRVQRGDHPELKRIVVGVDPPGSSQQTSEEPAECGIVVVGLGVNNHGYVLADYSLVGTPNEWASEAIKAYDFFKADRIIGEINFGGEMVGTIIKSLAKERGLDNIPFKAVRASRGKQVRAEPVSNLYQQNSVHHVGVLPDLEDQQCNWIPGEKSPDRLDACVWSITELMLDGKQGGGVYMEMPSEEEQQAYYEDDNVYSLWR